MGLDMYLTGKKYFSEYEFGNEAADPNSEKKQGIKIAECLNNMLGTSVCEVSTRLAYWRKANQVHAWFVKQVQDGTDDCKEYYVSRDDLIELYDLCKTILRLRESSDIDDIGEMNRLIETELPPQTGFFFGSTKIDEYYFGDLQTTIDQLEPVLKHDLKGWDIYYRSSW